MSAMYDPYGARGVPGPRRSDDMPPAFDPWETGERIFGSQWDTGEQRALDQEWHNGQRARAAAHRPVGHPRPARHHAQPPAFEASPPPASRRTGRAKLLVVPLVLLLLGVAGWQAWRLEAVNTRLNAVLTAEKERTDKLEKQVAGVFDPEAISSAVLPSVFRVRAGEFTGTAFSVGDRAKQGQANLLTNFHVVQSVWDAGDKEVLLERGQDSLKATIVKVSKSKDLALLRAAKPVKGLTPAASTVRPGQQIVVVGAPLGLEDTVTTGVVSAYRANADGPSIQFDAPINPGNSGGPVVNASDEVVGLATAKARDAEGIGLAVPIKTACDTFDVC